MNSATKNKTYQNIKMNWNQNAINRIRQCYPTPPTQGPVGRKPIDYLTTLRQQVSYHTQRCDGSSTQPLENLHPCVLGQCTRVDIRAICCDPDVDVLEAYAAVMAWGGQRKNWFQTSIRHHVALRQLLCLIRFSIQSRSQDFDTTKLAAAGIKGLGISFYTKLLYFFRPTSGAYILDQWTAKSIRMLTGNIIRLTKQGTPDPTTNPGQYEDFCATIDQLAQFLGGWTGDQVEQALFDLPGGCWRTYIEANIGAPEPDAPEAPEHELEIDEETDLTASDMVIGNQGSGGNLKTTESGERRCSSCWYWGEHKWCRVNPPVIHPTVGYTNSGSKVGVWPRTSADDWCGSFRPNKHPSKLT